MLFLVPLLAGFLRPVRVSVEKANAAIDSARSRTVAVQDVARGAKALADLGGRMRERLLSVGTTSPDDAQGAEQVLDPESRLSAGEDSNRSTWSIGTPLIPRPWAMAFSAALLILLADTIFQIWCPALIRQASLDEYVDNQSRQFASHPSRDTLVNARRVVAGQSSTSELTELEKSMTMELKTKDGTSNEFLLGELQQVRTNLVDIASRMSYMRYACRFRPMAWLCFLLYSLAACIVLKILQEQTLNVVRSAGWWHV